MKFFKNVTKISWYHSKTKLMRRFYAFAVVVGGVPSAVLAAIAGGIGILIFELRAIWDLAVDLWTERGYPTVYTHSADSEFESSDALWAGAPTFPDTKPPKSVRKSLTTDEEDHVNV